jgi:hypothetical protein
MSTPPPWHLQGRAEELDERYSTGLPTLRVLPPCGVLQECGQSQLQYRAKAPA